ncbi:MAG TPA: beta-ketoacyl-[acyl-carrier-protein] synthase family protein [Myxococcota bacterium]|nr:beta-ketoacyl-[acyl-carrier-protein] synthase family protein [Myxococcota bacterium]HRY92843.1 beta-ketoacyl-[acyl-carrier-protein] synthase family protein [Myxococcota bacterium]HSA20288.1 beta-ketoacyl-[acyl-carrier-protein] synthase family protein [Myxococcota bacterium]
MAQAKPVLLGHDLVSPLGTELEDQWRRALAGQSGVGRLTRFPLDEAFPVDVAGQVPELDAGPYEFLRPRAMAHWTSPIFPHALLVVHRALARAGLEITPSLAPRVATTFSSAVGGLDAVLAADRRMIAERKLPHPFVNPNSCINMVGGKVSMLTGATGPIVSTVSACATGCSSLIVGAMLIASGQADVAVCGAVDFCLVEPIVAGFATMNGAAKRPAGGASEDPARVSRPFSVDRRGFVVSEGAAALVLASADFARAHGLHPRVELAGYGQTSDAHHFVAPHLPTVERAMRLAIESAGLAPGDIDAVNAHATSTKAGDAVEAEALRAVFGARPPPVTANKSLLGHAMGAASAIETVLAVEGLLRGELPPTLNHTPDPELGLVSLVEQARPHPQRHVLKNAFGFGGCNACLVLGRLE